MKRRSPFILTVAAWGACLPLFGATFTEDFATNPADKGWQVFGNTNQFVWDGINQNVRVFWDSAKSNSYFHRPLGTILAHEDEFQLSFDLTFESYAAGVYTNRPGAMEAAIGFLNIKDATQTNFLRGSGANSTVGPRNIVEFDFFPSFDTFLSTIAQTIIGTNSQPYSDWGYNHDNLEEMTPGQIFHIFMDYQGNTRTLTTVVSNNGVQYVPPQAITMPTNVDFRLTSLAISCYSHQNSFDSLLATGRVDNISMTTPPPPVQNLTGQFVDNIWQAQFTSRTNWVYTLERTTGFDVWTNASGAVLGNGATLSLPDTNPPATAASYRVRANRP